MLAIEADGVGVVLAEQFIGVHRVVVDAEQAVGVVEVEGGDAFELLAFHGVVVLDDVAGDAELRGTVFSSAEELVGACLQDFRHGAHVEGGVDTDLPESEHLLGVHPSHRRADDDVRLLLLAVLPQVGQGFLRVDGYVGGYHRCLGQHLAEAFHRSRGAGGAETVEIGDCHSTIFRQSSWVSILPLYFSLR